jgi:LPS sulfotransferase NodH
VTAIVATPLNEIITSAVEGAPTTYDPSGSPLHGRAVFLVGAPRSGTTWLHQLLAVHPDVATSGESHVFCEGFATLFANHDDVDVHMNLSTWVSRAELLQLTRSFVDGLFTTVRDRSRPAATHVLDKTPNHRPHAALLGEVYPDATFVHIVRDGRDMASSAHALWSAWGDQYRGIGDAAAVWAGAITDIRHHLGGLRYHEVRYEELVADPVRHLTGVLDAIGLAHDEELVDAAVAFGKAPINVAPSDARTGTRKWGDLQPDAARAVALAAGDLLVELGYVTPAERDAALAHRSLATVRGDVRAKARADSSRVVPRAGRVRAQRKVRHLRQDVEAVREPGRRVAEGALAGDRSIAEALHADVTLELADGEVVRGAAAVTDRLVQLGKGARISHVDADQRACAVQLVDADGVRQLQRLYVEGGLVARVVVQGT